MVVAYTDDSGVGAARPIPGFRFQLSHCPIHLYAFLICPSVSAVQEPYEQSGQFAFPHAVLLVKAVKS